MISRAVETETGFTSLEGSRIREAVTFETDQIVVNAQVPGQLESESVPPLDNHAGWHFQGEDAPGQPVEPLVG